MDDAAGQAAGEGDVTSAGYVLAGTAQGPAVRDQALGVLRWHWGHAYEIGEDSERGWWAKRRDGIGGLITAASPDELHAAISVDYAAFPVSPEFDPGER